VRPEIQAKTQIGAARKMKSGLRNKDEPKIKELLMPELEIVTIQVVLTASMSLRIPMEERVASGTNLRTRNSAFQVKRLDEAGYWLAGSIQNSVVAGRIIKSISSVPSEFARDQSVVPLEWCDQRLIGTAAADGDYADIYSSA